MGNCVCMQGLAHGSGNMKTVAFSGGGDSVRPFLENAASVHPIAAEITEEEVTVACESKVVRLKLVLTKAEVAKLLASGAVVQASDKLSPAMSVLEQLADEPESLGSANRAQGQQTDYGSCAWRPALESIPEYM